MRITLTINREYFESGKKDVPFQGSILVFNADEDQNEFGFSRFRSMKTLDGAFKLSEAEMNEGGGVAGTLKMNINESWGGFSFGGGRSRGTRR